MDPCAMKPTSSTSRGWKSESRPLRVCLLARDAPTTIPHGTWQRGAEYDGREERLTRYENEAKSNKEGLWLQANGETPAQYKKRVKAQG